MRPSIFFSLFLFVSLLAVPAATAETVSVVFQDVGLATQDIDVFDSSGTYLYTINTTSVVGLNSSEHLYTFKLKPQATNQDPGSLLQQLLDVLKANLLVIAFVLMIVFFVVRRR